MKQNQLLLQSISCVLLAIILLTGCGASGHGDYQSISMKEAQAAMEDTTDYILLDVRTVSEYNGGHIPGAICLPNEEIGDTQPELLPDKDQTIYVYCRSGNRSKQAAKKLSAMGYTAIVEIGGINSWPGETVKEQVRE